MESLAFSQLLDKGLSAEGALATWCPTMDLLALATADGQLHVHRLNWQRLWWTSPEAAITALEWRPDGKQLAVGLEDGTVLLLSTEDGEVQHRAALAPGSALVAISWTQADAPHVAAHAPGQPSSKAPGPAGNIAASASSQLSDDRARRLFAPPPPPVPAPTAGLAVGYATLGKRSTCSQPWPPEPARLAVLACASAAGDVVLCTSRLFPLGRVQLQTLLGCHDVTVLRVATAPSLQQLAVCWCDTSSAKCSSATIRLSTLGMQHIGRHAAQLHRLAAEAAHVGALLEGCQSTFQAACKEWDAGMHECEDSRNRLASLMGDYGTSGEPAEELQNLLATGAVGGALQQYITATLGEAGLKKLARTVDAAVCSVHNLITDHLQPQLEQLAFRLGELRGLALWLPWRRVTGLQPDKAVAAEQLALQLVLRSEAVRRSVVRAGAQFRTFFAWLLIVLRRMQEDASDVLVGYPCSQLEAVEDFLAGQYRRDEVGPMLGAAGNAVGGEPADAGASCGGMLCMVMEALGGRAGVHAADSTASASPTGKAGGGSAAHSSSLGHLLHGLQSTCQAAFGGTSELISPTIAPISSLALGSAPSAVATSYLPSGGAAVAVAWKANSQVLVLRSTQLDAAVFEAALLQPPEGAAVIDLAFYRDGQLALLITADGGSPSTVSSQLSLLPQEHLRFMQLPQDAAQDCDALQLCQMLLDGDGGLAVDRLDECRQRRLPYPRLQPPLAVSASRGVGCVLAGTQRVLLYDLEDNDEEGAGEAEVDEQQHGFETPPR